MKFYAVNGSPRKRHNTAILLQHALDGIKSAHAPDAETELIHLYDFNYKPCVSCFQCKLLGGKSYGRCAINDELTPLMEKLAAADGIVFGSPIYLGNITGGMRSFFERFLFQYLVYDANYSSLSPKRMPTAFIYTMGVPESRMREFGYLNALKYIEMFLERIFSKPAIVHCCDTYQFDDYAKYKADAFSEPAKAAHRAQQFPTDCEQAFQLGAELWRQAAGHCAGPENIS